MLEALEGRLLFRNREERLKEILGAFLANKVLKILHYSSLLYLFYVNFAIDDEHHVYEVLYFNYELNFFFLGLNG